VLYLLSTRRQGPASSDVHQDSSQCDTDSSSDTSSLPPTPTEPTMDISRKSSRTVIHIDFLPDEAGPLDSLFDLQLFPAFDKSSTMPSDDVVRVSQHPRPLRSIDPTVTFLSDSPISAKSTFAVLSSGMTVFSETTILTPAGTVPDGGNGRLLYSTTLVPGFWHKISTSSGMLYAPPFSDDV
jgi:transcriptional enhancer factor